MVQQPKRFSAFMPPSSYIEPVPLDTGGITAFADEYKRFMTPFLPPRRPLDQQIEFRQKQLQPFLTKPRTKEEILSDQQAFFGDDTQKDAEIQGALALAKYGSQVAQTPGSLLQALVAPAGTLAEDFSKIAASRSATERAAKEFAYNTEIAERQALEEQKLELALGALKTAEEDNRTIDGYNVAIGQEAFKVGLDAAKLDQKTKNTALANNFSVANQFNLQKPTFMAGKNPETGKFEQGMVYASADPNNPRVIIKDGEYVAVPDYFVEMTQKEFGDLQTAGQVDFSKAKPKNFLVPDESQVSGYKEVPGFTVSGAHYVYLDANGQRVDGNPNLATPAPAGYLMGSLKDVFEVSTDNVGRTKVTIKQGDKAGESFISSFTVPGGPGGEQIISTMNLGNKLDLPKYEDGKLISGNPMVFQQGGAGVRAEQLSPERYGRVTQAITALNSALNGSDDVFGAIPEAVGPYNAVKSFATNYINALVPNSEAEWTRWLRTEGAKTTMRNWTRQFVKANALSDRYAMAEQEILTQLAENPDRFWSSPEGSLARFKELNRQMLNALEDNRALLENRDPLRLRYVPTGTKNDPFEYSAPGQYDYLTSLAGNPKFKDQLKDIFVRMSPEEAKNLGFPESAYKNKSSVLIRLDDPSLYTEEPSPEDQSSLLQETTDEVQISKLDTSFPEPVKKELSKKESIDTIVRTIAGEAAGESQEGRLAVANVVINRLLDDKHPDNVFSITKKKNSEGFAPFSAFNSLDKQGNNLVNISENSKLYKEIEALVTARLSGQLQDNTGGATYYYNPSVVKPSWADQMIAEHATGGKRIGKHFFVGAIS